MLRKLLALLIGEFFVFIFSPPVSMSATGGPDAGGYSFSDSREGFSWTDIINGDGDFNDVEFPNGTKPQDISEAIPIGFNFNFYGKSYSEIYVSSYGYLTFEDYIWDYCNVEPIPSAGGSADNFIAGLWGYLNPKT